MWSELKKALSEKKSYLLTTHVSPDGDGLGAQLALRAYLLSLGKTVHILNAHPAPERYEFVRRDGLFIADGPRADEIIQGSEATVFLDTASWSQLGSLEEKLRGARSFRVAIDHHPGGTLETELAFRDEKASATCELLYDFLKFVDFPLDEAVAGFLFMGIATDTGWFRYANTTAKVFEMASNLCRTGARCSQLYHDIFEQDSVVRLRLLGRALTSIATDASGQVVYFYIDQEMFRELRLDESDTENFISYARYVRDGRIMILFKETAPGTVRVSFRSRGDVDVRELACEMGGGGHHNAAGATAHGELAEVIEAVLARARDALG